MKMIEYLGDGDHGSYNEDIFQFIEDPELRDKAEVNLRNLLREGVIEFDCNLETGEITLLSFNGLCFT